MGRLAAGTVVGGDYRIVRPLSEGGMGSVYVVDQLSTSKQRAMKLMRPELLAHDGMLARFEQEARIGARIASEHIVEVVGAGIQDGTPYLVMELLDGELLFEYVKRRGAVPAVDTLAIMKQLCHAVGAAHDAGVVHRDLKPENVFMAHARRADSAYTVKVLDFGIAKLLAEGNVKDTAALGSPIWLAPEQTERTTVTPGADVWALGLIAFHLLTGRYYWRSMDDAEPTVPQVMRDVVFGPLPSASSRASELGITLPTGFDDWFSRCVVREPSARWPNARAAYEALAATMEVSASAPTPVMARTPVRVDSAMASAPTELEPSALLATGTAGRRASSLLPMAAGLAWVFVVGYPGLSVREMLRFAGDGIFLVMGIYVGASVLLALGKSARWAALSIGIAGTFSTYVGWLATLSGIRHLPTGLRFTVLHEGLYEANVGRFVGFALSASVILAILAQSSAARSREEALPRAAASVFAVGCAALSVLTRVGERIDLAWINDEATRSERVRDLVHAAANQRVASLLAALAILGATGFWLVRIRKLPGSIAWQSATKGYVAILAVALLWAGAEAVMQLRLASSVTEIYAAIGPELEVFAQLDPPTAEGLPRPPAAPTLKLAHDRIALDAIPVGLVSALETGTLDAVLLADLSHRLADPNPADPPLLLMADRASPSSVIVAALRVVHKAGVDHVGVLYTRGPAPVLRPGDPPEAAYAVPSDFGMVRVELSPCAVSDLNDWATTFQARPTLCVGSD